MPLIFSRLGGPEDPPKNLLSIDYKLVAGLEGNGCRVRGTVPSKTYNVGAALEIEGDVTGLGIAISHLYVELAVNGTDLGKPLATAAELEALTINEFDRNRLPNAILNLSHGEVGLPSGILHIADYGPNHLLVVGLGEGLSDCCIVVIKSALKVCIRGSVLSKLLTNSFMSIDIFFNSIIFNKHTN